MATQEQVLDDLSSLEKLKAQPATLRTRILATTIDVSMFLPLFLLMLLFMGYYYAFAVAFAFLAYNILLESSAWHATLGKRMMGLKVVREDGKLVSTQGATIRNLIKLTIIAFPLALLILHLFYIVAKDDRRKLALHNKLAQTRVIQVKR